jgi:flagellin
MGFRINTNINSIDTQRNLMMTSTNMATTMRRLSSGLRINSAADDAAGLAISQKLGAQVNGLNQAVQNAQGGISLVQTAEGALNETQSILQRMRTLAVQSANDTNTSTDRTAIQSEMNQLATEISRISNTTSFNTKNLLAGGFANQTLQIGANTGETMSFGIAGMDAASLGVSANGATVSTNQNQANILSTSNVGTGFKNGINYTVKDTSLTAGALADANGASNKGVTQGQNIGNEQLNTEGAFAGSAQTNYTFRVSGVDPSNTKVTQVQYSTDGGSTWATSQGQIQSNGTYDFQVSTSSATPTTDSGLKFNFSLPTSGAINPALGDQFAFTANPQTTATSLATTASIAANQTISNSTNVLSVGAVTGAGNYLGSLSGAMSVVLTVTNSAGPDVQVTGATINIGGTAITATSGATPAGTVGASFTASAAAGAGSAVVNFMGMSFKFAAITANTGVAGTSTVTYSMGTVNPVSIGSSSQISSSDTGSYTTAVDEVTGLAAGGATLGTSNAITATISGQYTGASGNLQIRAAAGNWNAPTMGLITNTGTGTAVALPANYTYAAGVASFTYNGAKVTLSGLPVGPTAGDIITVALANNSTSPGSDMAVTATANAGSSTAATVSQNVGNEVLNTAGAFIGTSTTNYLTKVSSVSGSQVTGLQFSTDGGTTWGNATANALSNGSYTFQVQQKSSGGTSGSGGDSGMLLSFTAPANGVTPQIGDQFSFQSVASSTQGTAAVAAAIATGVAQSGTYNGPYAGAITVTATTSAGSLISGVTSVAIGSTTLDASQVQYNATANTISFLGLTYTLSGLAASGTGTITGNTVTPASNAISSNLAGTTAVTTGNLAAATAPAVTATATQIGGSQLPAGLGAGSILLDLKHYDNAGVASGGTAPIGINAVSFIPVGNTGAAQFSTTDNGTAYAATAAHAATSADFSYNSVSAVDTYTSGSAYGGSLSVTGADGNTYKIVVANATSAGATVSIQNAANTQTYATYNVTTSGAGVNDVVALNLAQSNITNTGTQNLGSETAAVSGTYTGSANQQFVIKVAQTDANGNVSQVAVSTDGGHTFGSAIAANSPYANPSAFGTVTSFGVGQGLTVSLTPGQFDQNKAAVGDTFNFVATASSTNGGTGASMLQLQNTDPSLGTINLGGAQLIQQNQTTATVGASTKQMVLSFGALGTSGGLQAGSTTVTSQASQAAVIGANDTVVSNATAYAGLDVTSQANAESAISTIDAAINTVSLARAQLGAIQNRLQHTINNLSVGSENLTSAQSEIQDVNVAAETANMTKDQVLEQAGISVLAQANQQPQMVLKLLQ